MTNRAKTTPASTSGSFAPDTKAEPSVVLDAEPVCEVDEFGTKRWMVNGKLHRTDGPAFESADGSAAWCLNGLLHREGGPASEAPDGFKAYYRHGKRHRIDGPSVIYPDGTKEWHWMGVEFPNEELWRATVDAAALL